MINKRAVTQKLLTNTFDSFSECELISFVKIDGISNLVFEKLPDKFVDISTYENLLYILFEKFWPAKLIQILQNSVSKENNSYILDLISKVYVKFEKNDFIQEKLLDICLIMLKDYDGFETAIFEFIKEIIKKRDEKTILSETDKDETISEILKQIAIKKRSYEDIIKFIYKHYNLIQDDGDYTHYTPKPIFDLLKEYINLDFYINFDLVVKNLIHQYKKYYPNFKGTEFFYSGSPSWGGQPGSFKDNHYLEYTLIPALKENFKLHPKRTWEFILKKCVTTTKKNITAKRPDFLNRAALPILLGEYRKNNERSKEAEIILKKILTLSIFTPSRDIIFQNLLNADFNKKWSLVSFQLDYYEKKYKERVPANEYVEQIILQSVKNHKEAQDEYELLLKNKKFLQRKTITLDFFITGIKELIESDIVEKSNQGISLYESFIFGDGYNDNQWRAWELAKFMPSILKRQKQKGLAILLKIVSEHINNKNLIELLTSSLTSLDEGNIELLNEVFITVVSPLLKKFSNKDIEKVMSVEARIEIVRCAEHLAKAGFMKSAWEIIEFFCKDSNPDIDDSHVEEMKKGKDTFAIATVRGYVSWALVQFGTLRGKHLLSKSIPILNELSNDRNYYVRLQATYPLRQYAGVRHSVLPDNNLERFMTLENANRIENIAFEMLENKQNQKYKALMKQIVQIFSNIRTINTNDSLRVLNVFKASHFTEVIDEALALFLFFAEFRKQITLELVGVTIEKYDDKPAKDLLDSLIRTGNKDLLQSLSWHLWQIVDKNKDQYNKMFEIAYSYYLKILANVNKDYSFDYIYHFLKDNIEKKYKDCIDLFEKLLEKEKDFYDKVKKDKLNTLELLSHPTDYDKIKILLQIADRDTNKFLSLLDFILYEIPYSTNMSEVIDRLTKLSPKEKKVKQIFKKINRLSKDRWLDKEILWEKQKN